MVSELISALIMAVVQGLTEWLPVSSSGHLLIAEKLLGFGGGMLFDVAVHFGTLVAVFVYFGRDVVDMVEAFLKGAWKSEHGRLFWLLILASVPAGIIGFFFRDLFEIAFASLGVAAVGFGVTGLLLLITSLSSSKLGAHPPTQVGKKKDNGKKVGVMDAVVMGVAQVFALLPGISRSGATLSTGVLSGLKEETAVKFAFLMSIPVIFGANILVIGNQRLEPSLIWATLVSFLVGLGTIHILYSSWLKNRKNLKWFGGYALVLAVVVGVWSLVG